MANLLDGNLLDPLTFTEGEISIFIRDNKCALCGGYLSVEPVAGRMYRASCLKHGLIYSHNYASKTTLEIIHQGEQAARVELRPTIKKTEAQLLHELGF